jgi:AcrR family transcriptional regulator
MNISTRKYDGSKRKAQAAARRKHIAECAGRLLLENGFVEFTLEQVAERAGCTVQTILRAYGTKHNLFVASLSHAGPADPDHVKFGTLVDGDVRGLVQNFYEAYESIGDGVIRLLAEEHRQPALKADADVGRNYHHEWTAKAFAEFLDPLPPAQRRILYHGLLVSTDIYLWQLLRRDEGLELEEAVDTITAMINGLLKEIRT